MGEESGDTAAVAARAAGREENPKRLWVRQRPVRLHTALPAPQPRPGVSEQSEDAALQLAKGLKPFLSLSLTFRSGNQGSGVNCFCCKCRPTDLHMSAALAGGEGAKGLPSLCLQRVTPYRARLLLTGTGSGQKTSQERHTQKRPRVQGQPHYGCNQTLSWAWHPEGSGSRCGGKQRQTRPLQDSGRPSGKGQPAGLGSCEHLGRGP